MRCSSCSCATPARCSPGRSSWSASGATSSPRGRTRSRCTSDTCGARPRRAARSASSRPCTGSATRCGSRRDGAQRAGRAGGRGAMRRLPLVWRLALCSGVAAAGSVITVLAGAYVLACRRVADLGKEGALGPYYGDSGLYVPVGPAGVLDKVAALQAELGWPFIVVALGGLLLAAVLGYIAARTALRPVATLTAVAERVAATRDLGTRIEVDRD